MTTLPEVQMWSAIILLNRWKVHILRASLFLFWFTQSQVICADLDPYSTETPQICRPLLPHSSLSLLGPTTRPGVQRCEHIFPPWTCGLLSLLQRRVQLRQVKPSRIGTPPMPVQLASSP